MPQAVETLAHAIERVRNLSAYSGYKDKETHIFAVVYECDQARQTRGSDMIITLSLMDDSLQSPTGPQVVELIVFGPTTNDMPQAQRGDIIELRHVLVQFWDPPTGGPSRPQLFGKLSRPHPFGYLLYKPAAPGAAAEAAQPYKTFNVSRIGGDLTVQKLAALWPLASEIAAPTSTAREPTTPYLYRIHDLEAPEDPSRERPPCIDMRVQILAIDKRSQEEEVVLFVWDATDVRPLAADLTMLPSIWRDVELKVSRPRRQLLPLVPTPGVDVVPELPPVGSAVPVVMEAANVPRGGLPAVGSWVKLKVVGLLAVQGQLQVVFGPSSRITECQPHTNCEPYYKARLANDDTSEWPSEAARDSNIVTCCSRQELRHVTLRQVHQRAAQQQPGPFRVLLRLTGYLPRDLRQWCRPLPAAAQQQEPAAGESAGAASSSQQQQQQQQQQAWEWAAHLLLEDATGDLRALLLGREATRLLGLPPTDLSCHAEDVQQLQQRLDALSAVDQYGGTWMDVAITPVYTPPAVQQQQQHVRQEGECEEEQRQQQQEEGRQQQQQAGDEQHSQEGHQQPGHEQQEAAEQPQHGQASVASEAQQQQHGQQPEQQQQPRSAEAAGSGGSAGPSRLPARQQYLFIVHDAVCPHMLAEEDMQGDDADREQQQQEDHVEQQQNSGGEGSSRKSQREEAPPGSGGVQRLQRPDAAALDGVQQELDPATRAARERQNAMTFM